MTRLSSPALEGLAYDDEQLVLLIYELQRIASVNDAATANMIIGFDD